MLLNIKFDVLGRHINMILRAIKQKDNLLYGVGNRCNDASYILFLDYDNTPLDWVTEEIRLLQRRYNTKLGTAYLFKTRKGIHALFLEKNDIDDIIEMMRITSSDKQHKEIPLYYGRRIWVLRGSPKKDEELMYLGCLTSLGTTQSVMRSNAHKKYLQLLYTIPESDFYRGSGFDDENELTLAYYHVGKDDA